MAKLFNIKFCKKEIYTPILTRVLHSFPPKDHHDFPYDNGKHLRRRANFRCARSKYPLRISRRTNVTHTCHYCDNIVPQTWKYRTTNVRIDNFKGYLLVSLRYFSRLPCFFRFFHCRDFSALSAEQIAHIMKMRAQKRPSRAFSFVKNTFFTTNCKKTSILFCL